jgi:hypothetical protein
MLVPHNSLGSDSGVTSMYVDHAQQLKALTLVCRPFRVQPCHAIDEDPHARQMRWQ